MIRPFLKSDISIIYKLGLKYDNKFDKHYDLDYYLNNPIYNIYLYDEDKSIKGFIITLKMDKNVEILLIYVDDLYRKQGIASKLLKYIENDTDEILLEVSKDNNPAINLYNKFNYEQISIRTGYYNGIDALVMKKVLK